MVKNFLNKKRGSASFGIGMMLSMILVIFGVVLAAMFIMNVNMSSFFNELPDFPTVNESEMEEKVFLNCDYVVGFVDKEGKVIGCQGGNCKKTSSTDFYIKKEESILNVYHDNTDSKIGHVEEDIFYFNNFMLRQTKNSIYNKLHGSDYRSGVLCKSEKKMEQVNHEELCKDIDCTLFEGSCRENAGPTKVYGETFELEGDYCSGDKKCFISPSQSILNDDGLEIKDIQVEDSGESEISRERIDLSKVEETSSKKSLIKEDKIILESRYGFFKWETNLNDEGDYCFLVGTDKAISQTGYVEKEQSTRKSLSGYDSAGMRFTGKEEALHFIAWRPWKDERVLKRFEIDFTSILEIPGITNLEQVHNDDFKKEAFNIREGESFLVVFSGLDLSGRKIEEGIESDYFKVHKESKDKLLIHAWDERKNEWHELDCYPWKFGKKLKLNEAHDSLYWTLSDKCER